jgi:hypothetical protein
MHICTTKHLCNKHLGQLHEQHKKCHCERDNLLTAHPLFLYCVQVLLENGNWPEASQLPGQAWPLINGNILALNHWHHPSKILSSFVLRMDRNEKQKGIKGLFLTV